MNLKDFLTTKERREALEKYLGVDLSHIGNFSFDEKLASTRNCENMIGAVQVPIGVAGPLVVKNDKEDAANYFIPLATTEGALIASINRGCKAIAESGGVNSITKRIGITRAPVFVVRSIAEGKQFIENIEKHFTDFKKIADATSSHLQLLDIKPWMLGRNVYLRFRFDCQDAMGMNMATIATTQIASHIEEKTGFKLAAISGNMCVDKKPNYLNFIEGRGMQVWAEASLSSNIISSVLKTTPKKIKEVVERKLIYGSMLSGSLGSNAHMANVLSAIFLATGQDIAHIAECSSGITVVEIDTNEAGREELYISIYLPDLVIGTVGGGTYLETQKESLSVMGIKGGNNGKNTQKFAEIIGGAVLAGELSLLASLAEGSLAQAHQRLGRGNK